MDTKWFLVQWVLFINHMVFARGRFKIKMKWFFIKYFNLKNKMVFHKIIK